ncbi:MAG: hemerythrin domain-containing protein [Deltaproteobacteria bacterium]|nr:hemerythrin domain-containing protein [Deltaproteobacteria bacterium]MBW2421498.1 hemerythrin domain-containing protein [Deltaproteobacteria bacterium]
MHHYQEVRQELVDRSARLLARIQNVVADSSDRGFCTEQSTLGGDRVNPIVEDFLAAVRDEHGLIESAIRRIDTKEYDCCILCGGRIRPERLERMPYAVNCESCSRDFPSEYTQRLRAHHSGLRKSMARLLDTTAAATSQLRKSESADVEIAASLVLLLDLDRELPEHFAFEEKDGYLAAALAAAPRYHRKAITLQQEHEQLCQTAHALLDRARSAEKSPDGWGEIEAGVRSLSATLFAHEEAENDIMESAFLDDLGAGD